MFTVVSWASLGIAFICAIVIAIDEIRHPQKMWIMNVVWPVTALYFSVFGLWGYFRIGRAHGKGRHARDVHGPDAASDDRPGRAGTILPGAKLLSLTPTAALAA